MGKASHDEDLQSDPHQNVLNSSSISHVPGGGYESNPLHQTSFTSSNSHDFQPNNAQNFSKIVPSKTFDTQSLNLGNYLITFDNKSRLIFQFNLFTICICNFHYTKIFQLHHYTPKLHLRTDHKKIALHHSLMLLFHEDRS